MCDDVDMVIEEKWGVVCAEGNRFWICFDAHDQVLVTQAGVNKIISFEVL